MIVLVEFLAAAVAAVLISVLGQLVILGAKNRQKYQFFKKNAPGLKVVGNPSLFGGHCNQLFHTKYNWAKIEKLLGEQGPTVGFYLGDKPTVITTDLEFIKIFTIDEQIHTNRVKTGIPLREIEDDCIMFAEDEQWLRLRKAIAPAFTAHRIKLPGVQSGISMMVDKLVGLIERRLDEAEEKRQEDFSEVNAEDIFQRYMLALVFSTFYKQHDVVDFHSDEDKQVSMIDRNIRELGGVAFKVCAAFPALIPLIDWLVLNFHEQGQLRNTIMNYIKQQTKLNLEATKQAKKLEKIAQDQPESFTADNFTLKDGSKFKRNMIDYITDQYRERKLNESEYFNSTFFLFFAAFGTTSECLVRLFYNLAHNQEVQEKLRASIMTSGLDSEYLSWVVHETLRLHPPAPIGCSRTIKRDIQTQHGLVPAGTFVVTPAATIGRLKEYWGEDADEFRPERWANAKNFHPVQYLAFGGGRRACPGKELALMEIKMLVDVLMRRYKFEKSNIHTIDNSKLYSAPLFAVLVFDTPTYVRVSRLQSRTSNVEITSQTKC